MRGFVVERGKTFYSIRYRITSEIGPIGWVVVPIKGQSHAALRETIRAGNAYRTEEEATLRMQAIRKIMQSNPENLNYIGGEKARGTVYYITHYAGKIVVQVIRNRYEAKHLRSQHNFFTTYETASAFADMVQKCITKEL